jgi:hypothetical protein
MKHFVEVRSYNLKPGTRNELNHLFLEDALPLLKQWNADVIDFGPSPHDENSYYLIHCCDNLAHLEQSENAFYRSEEWRKGPREAILGCIENYIEIVFELDDATIHGLRKQSGATGQFVEIRSLNLKVRDEFQRIFIEQSLPILERWNLDVVSYGPSLHDENSFYVMRRFDSLVQRKHLEDAFYSSRDWRRGPRRALVRLIENYMDVVLELDDATVNSMRRQH